jgi:hypothetical protein
MDRVSAELALARAENHVLRGDILIRRQWTTIARSELAGRDVARSKELLSVFEDTQRSHVAERDRLREILQRPGP